MLSGPTFVKSDYQVFRKSNKFEFGSERMTQKNRNSEIFTSVINVSFCSTVVTFCKKWQKFWHTLAHVCQIMCQNRPI